MFHWNASSISVVNLRSETGLRNVVIVIVIVDAVFFSVLSCGCVRLFVTIIVAVQSFSFVVVVVVVVVLVFVVFFFPCCWFRPYRCSCLSQTIRLRSCSVKSLLFHIFNLIHLF